jgi:hypothetical protein
MPGPLLPAGAAIGKTILKKYGRRLLEKAKPLVEKSLKKFKIEDRKFKGAKGATDKVKEKLVKIDKMKKVNQKDIENVAQNKEIFLRNKDIDTQRKVMGELKDTRDKLSALEKNVKQKVRGSRPTESSFRNGGFVIQGKPKLAKKGWR